MGLSGDERAEGPVAGLVMFASATMLAAAAAGMFLGLGDELGEQARDAGAQSLSMARTTLEIRGLTGRILGGGGALDALNVTVALGPGSDPVTLDTLLLALTNRSASRVLSRGDAAGEGWFTVAAFRDADGSLAALRVLNHDDLASLDADLAAAANDLGLPPREPLRVELDPEHGAEVHWAGTTPATYGGRTIFTLR